MKTISKLSLCLLASLMLFTGIVAKASKPVASGVVEVGTKLKLAKTNISPYFPVKAMVVTKIVVGYQVMAGYPAQNPQGLYGYSVDVRYGEAQDYGLVVPAYAPTDIAFTGTVTSTTYTGTVSGTILQGNFQWTSPVFYSAYTPLVNISSVSPSYIGGVDITIVNP